MYGNSNKVYSGLNILSALIHATFVVGLLLISAKVNAQECASKVTAYVTAIEQQYTYNRFGAFNPGGMMYALRRDIVTEDEGAGASTKPIPPRPDEAKDITLAGKVRLRSDKRPRPLILRVHEGECLEVVFTNLLSPMRDGSEIFKDPETGTPFSLDSEEPATRNASMHVNGLDYRGSIRSDGANVGRNPSSLVAPGHSTIYTWYGKKEGTYLLYSMAAPAGGEGDGGQVGLGLFGAVNVEPKGSIWYRSQVTAQELQNATIGTARTGTPIIDYQARRPDGVPILAMLQTSADGSREIVHSDLNAVIKVTPQDEKCAERKLDPDTSCGKPYREFSVIFHDELKAVQAFRELEDEDNPLSALKDGMGINYGAAGLGAMVLANRAGKGPAKNCTECKLEEFFLTSWAMGDPALLVDRDANDKPYALYPDDPSNVHHSYLGDPVRFRNIHAGPKETHVFHLHAHQWLQDENDPNSLYLDSQTISPGGAFTYSVLYGGSGNRNLGPGDSIFHCHLYPHFAEGMWELWRTHDVFESGTQDRNLPDGEIAQGTPIPALVPLPDTPLAPMPTTSFEGYPFYIAGVSGHRPPQAPNDIEETAYQGGLQDTLGRHVVLDGDAKSDRTIGLAAVEKRYIDGAKPGDPVEKTLSIAKEVRTKNGSEALYRLAATLEKIDIRQLPEDGTTAEKAAMAFHAGQGPNSRPVPSPAGSSYGVHGVPRLGYPSCMANPDRNGREICDKALDPSGSPDLLFQVNGQPAKPGAPFADPCPSRYGDTTNPANPGWRIPPERNYNASYIQFDMPVNRHGWHDPQARLIVLDQDIKRTLDYSRPAEPFFFRANSGDCVNYKATNLIPSNLNLDDFQVFSPTDTIGQHIHLVKFDVTASDGSANGWNYEDGTFSADELRERILAYNRYKGSIVLRPKVHRLFQPGGPMANDPRGLCPPQTSIDDNPWHDHPWCGAQTTIQRWWADPLLNNVGQDRTIRTVFTHDHMGPSSHQHHGFYAALVVEPRSSEWRTLGGEAFGGVSANGQKVSVAGRYDGGPTSFAATILDRAAPPAPAKGRPDLPPMDRREYNLAVADFAIVYSKDNRPVNPPGRLDHDLPTPVFSSIKPAPEGISSSDPGTQVFNYRNEPIPFRIGQATGNGRMRQKIGPEGDLANVFSSTIHANQPSDALFGIYLNPNCFSNGARPGQPALSLADGVLCSEPPGVRQPGDSALPLLTAYDGDRLLLRLIQGAQEENHIFTMSDAKWLAEPGSANSGWRAGQHIGISEHFEFDLELASPDRATSVDRLYGTSSGDNLWDGLWGIVRSFGPLNLSGTSPEALKAMPGMDVGPFLAPLQSNPLTALTNVDLALPDFKSVRSLIATQSGSVCNTGDGTRVPRVRHFDVEAWRAKDLLPGGRLVFNLVRAGQGPQPPAITDPNAILYVPVRETLEINGVSVDPRTEAKMPASTAASRIGTHIQPAAEAPNPYRTRLNDLRNGDKDPEPLIVRAQAGECITIQLTNKVTKIPDGSTDDMNAYLGNPLNWSYNMLPPIIEGFNFNQLVPSSMAGLTPQLLSSNVKQKEGASVGLNMASTVAPGSARIYEWYAGSRTIQNSADGPVIRHMPIEFGAVGLRDMADVITHSSHGGGGLLIVEPERAKWRTDCDILAKAGASTLAKRSCLDAAATVEPGAKAAAPFREFALLIQDDLSLRYKGQALGNLRNGDDSEDSGQKTFNYRTEPFWQRLGANPVADPESMSGFDFSNVLSSWPLCKDGRKQAQCPPGQEAAPGYGDPATPLFTVRAGMPVRVRIAQPAGHPRNHGFTLFGHDWLAAPWLSNQPGKVPTDIHYPSYRLSGENPFSGQRLGSATGIGPGRHANLLLDKAGGSAAIAGDYLYRAQEGFAFSGGLWGIMRVIDPASCGKNGLTAEQVVCR